MSNHKFQRILIALEEAPSSQKIIDYAKSLHITKDTAIALLTVIPPIPSDQLGFDPILGQTSVVVPELTDLEQEIATNFLDNFKSDFPAVDDITSIIKVGNAKQEILAYAQEWSAELIIMGTQGKTGFEHFISGSVAESVTRKSSCPVLIIPNKSE